MSNNLMSRKFVVSLVSTALCAAISGAILTAIFFTPPGTWKADVLFSFLFLSFLLGALLVVVVSLHLSFHAKRTKVLSAVLEGGPMLLAKLRRLAYDGCPVQDVLEEHGQDSLLVSYELFLFEQHASALKDVGGGISSKDHYPIPGSVHSDVSHNTGQQFRILEEPLPLVSQTRHLPVLTRAQVLPYVCAEGGVENDIGLEYLARSQKGV